MFDSPMEPCRAKTAALPRNVVLVGDASTRRKAARLKRASRALEEQGLNIVDWIHLREVDRLKQWVNAPEAERPLVVAAGGDGTVGTTAGYLAKTGATFGILPLGTSNDIARSLQIPLRAEAACRLLKTGEVATIDVGQFIAEGQREQTFVHAAAMGIDVRFAQIATQPSVRNRFGPFTYAVSALLSLRHLEPFTCDLRIDGRVEHLRLLHLSIVNAPVFGGLLGLSLPGSHLDDRHLDVLTVEDMSLLRLLLATVPMLLRRHSRPGGVHVYHLPQIDVAGASSIRVSMDGEIAAHLPGRFVLASQALRIVTPAAFANQDAEGWAERRPPG